jgi:TM2 domain-containing membrane protein YozV
MINFRFTCPFCKESIGAPADLVGQTIDCPSCGESIEVAKGVDEHSPRAATGRNVFNARASTKRILPLLCAWLFLGYLGAHALYAEKTYRGFLLILLFLCLGFAGLYEMPFAVLVVAAPLVYLLLRDFIAIVTGKFTDGAGEPISKWT